MLKRLFLFACLSSSAFCFEKGAELFENKQYLQCAQTFLTEAKKNDVRVPFYIRFLSENALINSQELGEGLEQKWHECIQNVAFAPIAIGKGNTYLEISLLAQQLLNKTLEQARPALDRIETASRDHCIGYGFYVVGRFLENQSKNQTRINRARANQILAAYKNGAEYAHSLSILSLVNLPTKYSPLSKEKIDNTYVQESKVLRSHQASIGVMEKTISRFYNGYHDSRYGFFPSNGSRRGWWQFEGARQGDIELQNLCANYSNHFQTNFFHISILQNDEPERWVYFSALGGGPQAQARLGEYFLQGDKTLFPGNILRALSLFETVIEGVANDSNLKNNGFVKSCLLTAGSLLEKGEGVPQDETKAFRYFKLAADHFNDPSATFNTASMLENGRGVPQDQITANSYFEKAYTLGDSEATRLIGYRMFEGSYGYERNPQKALVYLNIAAAKGNLKALNDLYNIYGHHCKNAEGEAMEAGDYPVPQDNIKALGYLKQSAAAGNDEAQKCWIEGIIDQRESLPEDEAVLLVKFLERQSPQSPLVKAWFGMILKQGYRDILPKDSERALRLLKEAGKENVTLALHLLGNIYEWGECGVEKNYDTAREYYERSQDKSQSLTNLGFFHEMGYGSLTKNGKKAIELYEKALEMGDGAAANNLGALYQNGKFVEKDGKHAFDYYKKGYELGDPDASYQYALHLLQGLYCEKDAQQAKGILEKIPQFPDVTFTQAAIQWGDGQEDEQRKALLTFQRLAEEGLRIAQYTYGLLLYYKSLEPESEGRDALKKESKNFITLAEHNGFSYAPSALRLLINRSHIDKEEAKLIAKKLLKGDVEGARLIKQRYAEGRVVEEEQDYKKEISFEHATEELLQRDPESKRIRQEQYLAYFMDPLNKKKVSVKGLYKIAASQISQEGGAIAPTRGSGVKIKAGDNTLGFHHMHRSGQSSATTLDPGRIKSFRQFAENIT